MRGKLALATALTTLAAAPAAAVDVTLRGSPASMVRQHEVAVEQDYTFLASEAQLAGFVAKGILVRLEDTESYALASVSHPYARPEVATFVERLGSQYREACGERMVVTSLTRPKAEQPGNAHALSVHPTGMALDLRISRKAECRDWLEGTLLSLERAGVLDVTRERNPPHYHVAVFTGAYADYVARRELAEELAAAAPPPPANPVPTAVPAPLRTAPAPGAKAAARLERPMGGDSDAMERGLLLALAAGSVLTWLLLRSGGRRSAAS